MDLAILVIPLPTLTQRLTLSNCCQIGWNLNELATGFFLFRAVPAFVAWFGICKQIKMSGPASDTLVK